MAAFRQEEKRHSMPYHLDDTVIKPVEEQASMITKYQYKGVPETSKADIRSVPVKLRRKKMDEQFNINTVLGCQKFTTRQHAHYKNLAASPMDSF